MWWFKKVLLSVMVLSIVSIFYWLVMQQPVDQPSFEKEQEEINNKEQNNKAEFLKNETPATYQKPRQKVEGYDGPYTYELGSIDNPQLTDFVINIALKQCPFYEDDGAVYRSCIYDLREQAIASTEIASSTQKMIKDNCLRITEEYTDPTSLVANEIYSLCVTEKVVNID